MSRLTAKAGRVCAVGTCRPKSGASGKGARGGSGGNACKTPSPGAGKTPTPASTGKTPATKKSSPANRTASSRRWLQEHFDDPYVKLAWKEGYRSRAAYKLLEIQEKHKIIRPGMVVLDLGAAPGGWTQVAARTLAGQGRIVALDILPMDHVAGAEVLQGDFLAEDAPQRLRTSLGGGADVVLSDLAPNMSGFRMADHARGSLLAEAAMDFAEEVLNPGGSFVLKLFHGPDFHELVKRARRHFATVRVIKPEASRDRSSEQYLVTLGFRPGAMGQPSEEGEESDDVSA